jgi:nucleoside-diphosphate-sugar epimerase
MQTKIALIGSDSFLAGYLYEQLKLNHIVFGYSRLNKLGIENYCTFDYPKLSLDFNSLLEFEVIIYCAGSGIQAGVGEDVIYGLNTFFPIEIANFLSKNKFKGKLVTFGSYFEIGNNSEEKAFSENEVITSLLSAPNQYCVSKRLLTRFFQSADLGIQYFHLVLPTIYGKGENSNRLIPYLINTLLQSKEPKLTSGLQTRQYIHAKDVADLVEIILTEKEIQAGVYNTPSYETIQIKDIVLTVYKKLNNSNEPSWNLAQRYDQTMMYLALNPSKLRSIFPSWKPIHSIQTSIQEYL